LITPVEEVILEEVILEEGKASAPRGQVVGIININVLVTKLI
jgi:hypothetical protein